MLIKSHETNNKKNKKYHNNKISCLLLLTVSNLFPFSLF